jgi:hypothetical protein
MKPRRQAPDLSAGGDQLVDVTHVELDFDDQHGKPNSGGLVSLQVGLISIPHVVRA